MSNAGPRRGRVSDESGWNSVKIFRKLSNALRSSTCHCVGTFLPRFWNTANEDLKIFASWEMFALLIQRFCLFANEERGFCRRLDDIACCNQFPQKRYEAVVNDRPDTNSITLSAGEAGLLKIGQNTWHQRDRAGKMWGEGLAPFHTGPSGPSHNRLWDVANVPNWFIVSHTGIFALVSAFPRFEHKYSPAYWSFGSR